MMLTVVKTILSCTNANVLKHEFAQRASLFTMQSVLCVRETVTNDDAIIAPLTSHSRFETTHKALHIIA